MIRAPPRSTLFPSTPLSRSRPPRPGDDVRHIDWNVPARMQEPHVRGPVGERALVTGLVLDASASMDFGTADRRKADVAEGVALADRKSTRLNSSHANISYAV